jgi:hypothetical protein
MRILTVVVFGACAFAASPDARSIVVESVSRDWRDLEVRRNYTYIRHREEKEYSRGKVASTKLETYDVSILYGQPYSRLIARDGKPLSPAEAAKEQEKLDKEMAKRARESARERQSREEEERKDLEQERALRREIPDAFQLRLIGEETVNGERAWVIGAEPAPGYKPKVSRAKILTKMRGTLWISQRDYRWLKVDAEVIDTVSFGLSFVCLYPGTRLQFEQHRLGDDALLPLRANIRGLARLAWVKKLDVEMNTRWENYRRFSSDSRVVETALVSGEKSGN